MDEYLNNRQNEILWNLLADPASNGRLYASDLQNFVNDFPQSGLLHALLSHAEGGQSIHRAATYVNPRALYQLINSPGSLAEVSDRQIIQQLSSNENLVKPIEDAGLLKDEGVSHLDNFTDVISEPAVDEHEPEPEMADSLPEQGKSEIETNPIEKVIEDKAVVETEVYATHRHDAEASEDIENTTPIEENVADHQPINVLHEETDSTGPVTKAVDEEPVTEDEIIEYGPVIDETTEAVIEASKVENERKEEEEASFVNIHADEKLTETPTFSLAEAPHSIDDDVYDEIVGIESISFTPPTKSFEEIVPATGESPTIEEDELPAETNAAITEPSAQKERPLNMDDEAEKLIVGNIAATDYFVFDRAFTERKASGSTEPEQQTASSEYTDKSLVKVTDKQDVSRYDDDTLPYTFLWWLNKTRKEHAGIYQPFKLDTTQAIRRQAADELQQQYYENIFHLSSVEELDRSTAQRVVEFDPKRKEDRIIKKFIVEEPHINPPSSDKLDTENKAKKSSEDQDELVTETLAKIYTDQMLYHKAINTYKKLILKYPEKSRYFADQIEQLERKNN